MLLVLAVAVGATDSDHLEPHDDAYTSIDPKEIRITESPEFGKVYYSPERHKQNEFKFYNNTNIFVTLRDTSLKADDGFKVMEASYVRQFFSTSVKNLVDPSFEPKLRKVSDNSLQMTISSIKDLKTVAQVL